MKGEISFNTRHFQAPLPRFLRLLFSSSPLLFFLSLFTSSNPKHTEEAVSFSTATTQPLHLNTTAARSNDNKAPSSLLMSKTPSFLGSTRKLQPGCVAAANPMHSADPPSFRSEAVKEKKKNATASTNLVAG